MYLQAIVVGGLFYAVYSLFTVEHKTTVGKDDLLNPIDPTKIARDTSVGSVEAVHNVRGKNKKGNWWEVHNAIVSAQQQAYKDAPISEKHEGQYFSDYRIQQGATRNINIDV